METSPSPQSGRKTQQSDAPSSTDAPKGKKVKRKKSDGIGLGAFDKKITHFFAGTEFSPKRSLVTRIRESVLRRALDSITLEDVKAECKLTLEQVGSSKTGGAPPL